MSIQWLGLFSLLVGPSACWALYHLHKDRYQPEPPLYLLLSYALGICGGYMASQGYQLVDQLGLRQDAYSLAESGQFDLLLVYSVLVIGTVEELAKFLPFYLVAIRHVHFDEPIDGIIYASFVALGFASYENCLILPHFSGWEALGRSLALPMVHVMFASIWGYAASCASCRRWPMVPAVVVGLVLAIGAHGFYDFLIIGFPRGAGIAAPMIIGGIWVWRMRVIRQFHREHALAVMNQAQDGRSGQLDRD